MINFFGSYVDDNLLKTVEKYVAGGLIRTSLGHFQNLVITFIVRYGACVTNISLYFIRLIFLGDMLMTICLKLMKNMLQDVS